MRKGYGWRGCWDFAVFPAGQAVPFFYPGATAFTPEISVVNTGVVNDVQATVSHDRKYVTLTMRPSSSALLALRDYQFQQGQQGQALGNVGDPPRGANAAVLGRPIGRADDPSSAVQSSPSDILAFARAQTSVLHRTGMSRISRLTD